MPPRNCPAFLGILLSLAAAACNTAPAPAPPSISVGVTPLEQTVDENRSVVLTANVFNDPANKGVTWTLSGNGCSGTVCGALSNQTPTSATYTAPNPVSAQLTVSVVATSVGDSSKSATASLTVVAPPSITTASLPGGTAGGLYNATLQVSGGVPPYSWSVTSGSLPTGFSLNSTGTISGTSCTGNTSKFTVQVADSANPALTASAPLSITVMLVPLSIATTSLPNGVTDAIYNQMIQVTGGISPYAWSVNGGSLPAWATLNPSSGRISGIPGTTGTANFTLQVAEAGCSSLMSTQALSLSVVTDTTANDSQLNGHYAFLFNGFDDATKSQVAVAGSFTADGKGDITEGIEDENGPSGAALSLPLTGTYNIASNNTGAFTITTSNGSTTYAVALNSISKGIAQKARFIEFDDTTGTAGQRGSGILRLQDSSAFTLASIAGPYAFGMSGQNASGSPNAMVGAFSADGTGTISSGIADQNIAGTDTNPSLTGTYTAPTGIDGRASITLNPSAASTLDLTAYVVSASEFLAMTTDALSSNGLLSGTALSQTSTSFDKTALSSPGVYYLLGEANPTTSLAEIGLLAPDGNGNISVTYDNNSSRGKPFSATYSVGNSGRVTVPGWCCTYPGILYLVDKNKAFFLDPSADVGFGFLEPQAAAPSGGFSTASLSGTFSSATIAPSMAPMANASGFATLDGTSAFSETAVASTTSGLFVAQTTTGTYTVSSNGRGTVLSLVINTAGVGDFLIVGLFLLLCFALGRSIFRRRIVLWATSMLLIALLIAPTVPAGRPKPPPPELAFYVISPTKAVMMHQFGAVPGVVILEQ